MEVLLQLNSPNFSSTPLRRRSSTFSSSIKPHRFMQRLSLRGGKKTFTAAAAADKNVTAAAETAAEEEEPAGIDFAFVSPKSLPDGSLDVHYRSARGGQKLRDIMLDCYIDLYGPYDAPLSNCGGGGTCGTCLVEVAEGKELLTPRTDKEKELLKKKPKTWRLACQTMVGNKDTRGQLIIQQLPEWKAHEWEIK